MIHFRSERIAMIHFDSLWFSILIRLDSREKNKEWPYVDFNYEIFFLLLEIGLIYPIICYVLKWWIHRLSVFWLVFFWKTGWLEIVRRPWRSWVEGSVPMLTPLFLFKHTFGDYQYTQIKISDFGWPFLNWRVFLRKSEFCAEVGAKGIQGIDLISFGGVR